MDVTKWNAYEKTEWFSPEEASHLIPGSPVPATVRKWARNGKLPGAVRLPGGRWQIPVEAIDAISGGIAR